MVRHATHKRLIELIGCVHASEQQERRFEPRAAQNLPSSQRITQFDELQLL
jgi:hypothetical protein